MPAEEALLLESLDSQLEELPSVPERMQHCGPLSQPPVRSDTLRVRGQVPEEALLLEGLDSRLDELPRLEVWQLSKDRWLLQVLQEPRGRGTSHGFGSSGACLGPGRPDRTDRHPALLSCLDPG